MSASTALVPTDPNLTVEALAPEAREVLVARYLTDARDRLAQALEATEASSLRAEIGSVADVTRRLGLSKEVRIDAEEMVRRAEFALGKAIRKGQAEGTIRTKADGGAPAHHSVLHVENAEYNKPGPADFASWDELSGNGAGIYHLADGVSGEQFDEALAEAKAEENLSRANVVRKIKDQNDAGFQTRRQRADLVAELAAQGYSSRQMPKRVGVSEETVRLIARDFNIDIPADKIIGRTRRLDHTRMVESTVTTLGDLVTAINQIDFAEVDPAGATKWAISLNDSLRALNRFNRQIKEMAND